MEAAHPQAHCAAAQTPQRDLRTPTGWDLADPRSAAGPIRRQQRGDSYCRSARWADREGAQCSARRAVRNSSADRSDSMVALSTRSDTTKPAAGRSGTSCDQTRARRAVRAPDESSSSVAPPTSTAICAVRRCTARSWPRCSATISRPERKSENHVKRERHRTAATSAWTHRETGQRARACHDRPPEAVAAAHSTPVTSRADVSASSRAARTDRCQLALQRTG